MAEKRFQDLNLNNAFLFSAALEDAETCRLILEIILGRQIPAVCVHTEHSLLLNSDYRSIRLDIYASDELHIGYNVEMQNGPVGNLPKRSRYYQAVMDAAALQPGDDFDLLQPVYTIFICTFDPFGRNSYRYTFENRCLELDLALGDGTRKIFLNTKGKNKTEVPKALVSFLNYVENSTEEYALSSGTDTVKILHERVCALKKSREWGERYMQVQDLMKLAEQEAEQKGRLEGRLEGQQKMLELIQLMIRDGCQDQIPLLAQDTACLEAMLEKYGLAR